MARCAFCDIAGGRLDAEIVYEDEAAVAFLDHRPLFPGHVLVSPREHCETLPDLPAARLAPLFAAVQLLARAVERGLGAGGSFVAINNRVSQSVPHLHVHVVPRTRGDGLRGFFWPRRPYDDGEHAAAVAARLRTAVAALQAEKRKEGGRMSRYSYMIVDPVSAFDGEELPRLFDFVRACGYEGVELNYSRELGASLGRVRGAAAESGLEIPSILTGRGYEEGLCLCHPEAAVRGAAVAYLVELLDAAAECGSILVIGLLQGLRSDEPDPGAAQPRIAGCLREVAAAAEEKEVELVIEPINHLQVGFNNSVAEVRALAAEVASPALGPMVDTIHMNIEDPSLTQPIRDCGADLRHVHLCESNGGPFGSGSIDFASVLRVLDEIGYRRFASVKIYRNATHREAARSSIEHLRRLRG